KEKMDQPVTFLACTELLHASSWSRSSTAGRLHRLAFAQDLGRHSRGITFRDPFDLCPLGAELHLRRFRQHSVDRGYLLRIETSRHGYCGRGRHSYRTQSTPKRNHVDARCSSVHRDFRFSYSVSIHYPECRCNWTIRRPILEKQV